MSTIENLPELTSEQKLLCQNIHDELSRNLERLKEVL